MIKRRRCLVLCLGLIILLCYPTYVIRLQAEQYDCYFYTDSFRLSWRHSVEQQNWIEFYQRQGRQLQLYETWLQTFGAGTPSAGELVAQTKAGYIGYKQQLNYPELNWVVSPRIKATIEIGSQTWPLYQWLPAYSLVHIQVQRLPFASYLLGRSCDE